MEAVWLTGPGSLEVVAVPDPVPGPGEVLIRVEANAICGSDLLAYRGTSLRYADSYPRIMGHEACGVVVDLGPSAPQELLGRRVAVDPNLSCWRCEECVAGRPNLCLQRRMLGESGAVPGACAQLLTVDAGQVHVLPESMPPHAGAMVQPLAISYHSLVQRGGLVPGERVLVIGAGPIGLGIVQLGVIFGAHLAVLDVVDHRLDLARDLGAELALRSDDPATEQTLEEWSGGRGAHLTIEAAGGAQVETVRLAQRMTGRRGRIVVLGEFATPEVPVALHVLKHREQQLLGSVGHPQAFGPVIELVTTGRLDPTRLVTHRIPLSGLGEAFSLLGGREGGVIKVVVEP